MNEICAPTEQTPLPRLSRHLQGICQDRWGCVWEEGLFDSGVANGWADKVWAEETDDDDEEED